MSEQKERPRVRRFSGAVRSLKAAVTSLDLDGTNRGSRDTVGEAKQQTLKQIFESLAEGGDQITFDQFFRAMGPLKLTADEAKSAFNAVDVNNDGSVSFKEFTMSGTMTQLELRAAFNLFDPEHTGKITADAVELVSKAMGVQGVSRIKIDELYGEADPDKVGHVDFFSFSGMVERTGQAFRLFDLEKIWMFPLLKAGEIGFEVEVAKCFPGSMPQADFVDTIFARLAVHGFNEETCIPCISLCRDEITNRFAELIQSKYSSAFTFSSLGGMLTCGKTGFGAAHHHAPVVDGRERYLYFAMPHIAIDEFGQHGVVHRPHRSRPSNACGALIAFRSEIESGKVRLETDPDDIEQSILKQRVFGEMTYGQRPSLVGLTKIAMSTIRKDLQRLVELTVDTEKADYFVVTGVQIHGPKYTDEHGVCISDDTDYIFPWLVYGMVDGKPVEIQLAPDA